MKFTPNEQEIILRRLNYPEQLMGAFKLQFPEQKLPNVANFKTICRDISKYVTANNFPEANNVETLEKNIVITASTPFPKFTEKQVIPVYETLVKKVKEWAEA